MDQEISSSDSHEDWLYKPHRLTGGAKGYKPRSGDVIYSDESAYTLPWGDAINQATPLLMVQVLEVYGLKVKFRRCEGFGGRMSETGEHSLGEQDFLTFLRTGTFAANG